MDGLTIEHGEPAAETDLATAWGVNNTVLLELEDRIYITETGAGTVSVSDDSGSDFQIVGTPAEFMEENTNFDISAALLHFIGDDDDVDEVKQRTDKEGVPHQHWQPRSVPKCD